MTTKLRVDPGSGKLTGAPWVTYCNPFPTKAGSWGSGAMMGVIEHTMAGWFNYTADDLFMNPANQASAHFCLAMDGRCRQMGPVGKGWCAWHAAAANRSWYGIEFEDGGNPAHPLTAIQLDHGAALVECLASFAGFPLQVTNDVSVKGFGKHNMGGQAWSPDLHSCPDPSLYHPVRSLQRADMIARAKAIRSPVTPAPDPLPCPAVPVRIGAPGGKSLRQIAREHSLGAEDIVWQTAVHQGYGWGELQQVFLRAGDWDADVPEGTGLWLGLAGQLPATTAIIGS